MSSPVRLPPSSSPVPQASPPPWAPPWLAGLVAVVGAALLVGTLALWPLSAKADRALARVRPELTPAGLAQHRADFEEASALLHELDTDVIPGVAGALGVTPDQLRDVIIARYPALAQALADRDKITAFARASLENLERRRAQFERADAIPVDGADLTTGSAIGIAMGAAVLACGVVALVWPRRRVGRDAVILSGLIGLAMVVGLLAFREAGKLSDADAVLGSLDPAQAVVDRTVHARDEVRAAADQLQNDFLPDVADTLPGAAPDQTLRLAFPDFFRGLDDAPDVLSRYDERVAIRIDAFPDLRTLKKIPLAVLAWAPLGLAALLVLAAVFVVVRSSRLQAGTRLRPPPARRRLPHRPEGARASGWRMRTQT